MFHYKLYYHVYHKDDLSGHGRLSCLQIYGIRSRPNMYFGYEELDTYYAFMYDTYHQLYTSNRRTGYNEEGSIKDKIGTIMYEFNSEKELTKEMLEFDEVTGLYGLIEHLKLPAPVAKFAGRKK